MVLSFLKATRNSSEPFNCASFTSALMEVPPPHGFSPLTTRSRRPRHGWLWLFHLVLSVTQAHSLPCISWPSLLLENPGHELSALANGSVPVLFSQVLSSPGSSLPVRQWQLPAPLFQGLEWEALNTSVQGWAGKVGTMPSLGIWMLQLLRKPQTTWAYQPPGQPPHSFRAH